MNTSTITPEDLRWALDHYGRTAHDLAAELDISWRTVYRWTIGEKDLKGIDAVAVRATLEHWSEQHERRIGPASRGL
jgi:DNA-binding transcriptional regulator YiaG